MTRSPEAGDSAWKETPFPSGVSRFGYSALNEKNCQMKKLTLIFCAFLFIACQSKESKVENKREKTEIQTQDSITRHSKDLSPVIEIWNHTGNDFIIDSWEKREDKYLKSEGWNLNDFPYPKKFDVKLVIVNNPILYDNPTFKIEDWFLSVNVKLKVGQNQDAAYLLNAMEYENIEVINNKLITDADFRSTGQAVDHIEIWKKDIEFESFYSKYKSKGLFINQLIFEIHLISESKIICNYEYIFSMAERGEL